MSFSLNPDFRENMKQKSITEDIEKISLGQSVRGVRNTAEKLFYYLLASEKNIEIKEKAYSLAEKQYRQTEINFKNGLLQNFSCSRPEYLQKIRNLRLQAPDWILKAA